MLLHASMRWSHPKLVTIWIMCKDSLLETYDRIVAQIIAWLFGLQVLIKLIIMELTLWIVVFNVKLSSLRSFFWLSHFFLWLFIIGFLCIHIFCCIYPFSTRRPTLKNLILQWLSGNLNRRNASLMRLFDHMFSTSKRGGSSKFVKLLLMLTPMRVHRLSQVFVIQVLI